MIVSRVIAQDAWSGRCQLTILLVGVKRQADPEPNLNDVWAAAQKGLLQFLA